MSRGATGRAPLPEEGPGRPVKAFSDRQVIMYRFGSNT